MSMHGNLVFEGRRVLREIEIKQRGELLWGIPFSGSILRHFPHPLNSAKIIEKDCSAEELGRFAFDLLQASDLESVGYVSPAELLINEQQFREYAKKFFKEKGHSQINGVNEKAIRVLFFHQGYLIKVLAEDKGGLSSLLAANLYLPNPVNTKHLGDAIREGLQRALSFKECNFYTTNGIKAKHSSKFQIVESNRLQEAVEPLLLHPKIIPSFLRRAGVLYLKNDYLGYHGFEVGPDPRCYPTIDPNVKWGIIALRDLSERGFGELVHDNTFGFTDSEEMKIRGGAYSQADTDTETEAASLNIEKNFWNEFKRITKTKSDAELFSGMRCCHTMDTEKAYVIAPTDQIAPGDFFMRGAKYVVISVNCTARELAEATLEGFERCETQEFLG